MYLQYVFKKYQYKVFAIYLAGIGVSDKWNPVKTVKGNTVKPPNSEHPK